MEDKKQRRVCVTGGTGFVASWLIMRLLQNSYSVNATIRTNPDSKKDISYLMNLPGASERLQIFNADLNNPETFTPAIKGCIGVFHVAHPMEWDEKETEETKTKRVIDGLLGILQASLDLKTVKRFVYTSSATAVVFNGKDLDIMDEDSWTDVEFMRSLGLYGESYVMIKTLAERTALEFGEKHGLDVVTLVPTWINGPFFGPRCPNSVRASLALIFGDRENYKFLLSTSFVHVDDVARASIFLLEYPCAKGRYICSAVEVTVDKLSEFLSFRYTEYQIPTADSLKGITPVKISGLSSKKLLETGFEYQYGLEEMFDGAIRSCKENGLL
ncbi:Flavonol reductase/cinnamoyl-CoA reductase [Handroanthus impetiginosus]|uniref:Dihydroflavonol 4-reductase n=1 Tax=Handroanthus impetiginosus TaxID=429701 RepID=A0A2G9I2G0_9LAMI|nr:Flavonol reductase/cinnamoyl-CoA reductase [Handroanthus impetiginosus]